VNRFDEFEILLNKMLEYDISNKYIVNDVRHDINVNNKILQGVVKKDHTVSNRKFIKCDYIFAGNLIEIMGYVSHLEDAVNYFQLIWGYKDIIG
jgi:hypothetical protein